MTDAIYALRLLIKRHCEKNKTVHLAFLDLEKAFELIPHDLIWHSFRSHDVPEAYVDSVRMLYHCTTSVIHCACRRHSISMSPSTKVLPSRPCFSSHTWTR